jgi:predicted component of type VI protein secretion system
MPRLVGQSPEIAGQVFDLAGAKITLGRTPDNDIHIADSSVSSHHAELAFDGADYAVRDLGSTNGTKLQGEKITAATLRRGNVVQFGNVELLYESEHSVHAASGAGTARPAPNVGIPLGQSASRGRPATFVATGPGRKDEAEEKSSWPLFAILASVLAIGALGYLGYSLFTAK